MTIREVYERLKRENEDAIYVPLNVTAMWLAIKTHVEAEDALHVKALERHGTDLPQAEDLLGLYTDSTIDAALDRFAEAGEKAWADVPDAAAWQRKQRGGSDVNTK